MFDRIRRWWRRWFGTGFEIFDTTDEAVYRMNRPGPANEDD